MSPDKHGVERRGVAGDDGELEHQEALLGDELPPTTRTPTSCPPPSWILPLMPYAVRDREGVVVGLCETPASAARTAEEWTKRELPGWPFKAEENRL